MPEEEKGKIEGRGLSCAVYEAGGRGPHWARNRGKRGWIQEKHNARAIGRSFKDTQLKYRKKGRKGE